MSETAYQELRDLTETGELEIYHVVAPPRSSSTALERALSNSPDIHIQVNDPWSIYDADRESQTYNYILGRMQDTLAAPQAKPLRMIIKDIADYIPPGEAWLRMADITQHTIFLIREPLLAMESMMRIMASEVPAKQGDAYAVQHGYGSWRVMQEAIAAARDYTPYDALYQQLFREEQPIHRRLEMQLPVLAATPLSMIQKIGFNSADAYAAYKGYESWDALVQNITKFPDKISTCQELLDENFMCRITGWTALRQHIDAMRPGDTSTVVDATMFRAAPNAITFALLQRLGLQFTPAVVDWAKGGTAFTPDYDGEVAYYDKVIQSAGVDPPVETPIPMGYFPAFVRTSLEGDDGALALYHQYLEQAVATTPPEVTRQILTATFDGKPLSEIDPIFYKELLAAQNNL